MPWFFYETNRKLLFWSLRCDRIIYDAISTGKMPENTRLHLVFSIGIFPVEMTSLIFLSQRRDTQMIFYLLIILHWAPKISNCLMMA